MPHRIAEGLARLKAHWIYALQAGLAAGLAYWASMTIFGHIQPFFAPMAVIIVLSTTGGERFRKSVELIVGCAIGVGLGDLLISVVGPGIWQISIGVIAAVLLGITIDKGPLVANQAAFASILVATILPPGTEGGFNRMIDALVGGIVGLIVISVFPESPLRAGRREIAKILGIAATVLHETAESLRTHDAARIQAALQKARGTQGGINDMISAAKTGQEAVRISPLLWRQRRRLKSMIRILHPVDNCIRNTRVLARRALILVEDADTVSNEQIDIIEELAAVIEQLQAIFHGKDAEHTALPRLVKKLRYIGAQAGLEVAEGRVLSAHMILGQSRSIIVDLLQICGLSRKSAQAVLRPTSQHPAQPPEIWED